VQHVSVAAREFVRSHNTKMPLPVSVLNAISDRQPFHVAWAAEDLSSGEKAFRHADVSLPTRSTRKVAILMALLAEVHAGRLDLAHTITIPSAYQHTASGVTQLFDPSPSLSIHDALALMIAVSDNGCTGALVDRLGLAQLNAWCARAGLETYVHRTALPEPTTDLARNTSCTPADQMRLFAAILAASRGAAGACAALGCDAALALLALRMLEGQQLRRKMPARLPADVLVAHKDGTGPGMHHDGGIVWRGSEPRFLFCAYTLQVPEELDDGRPGVDLACEVIAVLTRAIWDALA
jgi:beta-lactamase class A